MATNWTGANGNAANDPSNWTDGVPSAGLQGFVTLAGASVQVAAGATLDAGFAIGAPGGATLEALGDLAYTGFNALSGPNDGLVESFTLQIDAGVFSNLAMIIVGGPNLSGFVMIAPGATLDNAASGAAFGRISVGQGAALTIGGGGVLVNGGFISAADIGSHLTILAGIVAGADGGTVEIGSSSTMELAGDVAAAITTLFGPLGQSSAAEGLLVLDAPLGFASLISGFFEPGLTIDLAGAAEGAVAAPSLQFSETGGIATLIVGKTTAIGVAAIATLRFDDPLGKYAAANPVTGGFSIGNDAAGGYNINASAACFAAGTRIRTARGEIAVQHLRIGDRVRSVFGGEVPVIWLGQREVDCSRHPRPHDVWPVRVQADAFGLGQPMRDLLLSPDHAVHRDGVLIPIRYLLNGASVAQQAVARVAYWHVELPAHDVLLAEGLACESYLDTGNRASFAGQAVTMAHPDFALRIWEASSCAPLVTSGARLFAVRAALLARIASLGHRITPAAGLRLLADGVALRPGPDGDGRHFRLPPGTRAVRLVSRCHVPAEHVAESDDRRSLGVAVAGVRLDGNELQLGDPCLGEGWHRPEADWRWTDGDASLYVAGAREISLRLAPITAAYRVDTSIDHEAVEASCGPPLRIPCLR